MESFVYYTIYRGKYTFKGRFLKLKFKTIDLTSKGYIYY